MPTTPQALLDNHDLTGALAAAQQHMRSNPEDVGNRFLLFELWVLFEAFDNAARELATLPDSFSAVKQELGGLLSAEKRRRDCLLRGQAAPGFLLPPPAHIRPHFDALRRLVAGEMDDRHQAMIHALPPVSGLLDGEAFDGLRDCDDLLAPVLEFVVPGAYGWLPWTQLRSLSFRPPQGYTDTIWIPTEVTFQNHDGVHFVRIPSLYVGTGSRSDMERLGLETRWERPFAGLSRAFGQRDFVVEAPDRHRRTVGIRDIHEIIFSDLQAS